MLKFPISSSNINPFLETKVFLFFIIFFCLVFQVISYLTLWTETEIYPTHSSQYLFTAYTYEFLFSLKPIFYSLLKLSFLFSSLLDWLPMTSARFLFGLNGLAILLFMYLYIKNKSNQYNAVLAVLLLASANIFLDRAFRVRSDLLCTSFSLICLLINLNIKEQKDYWKYYIMLPLLFSTLLVSPKGLYWLSFSSVLLWHDSKVKPDKWLIAKTIPLICLAFIGLSFLFKDLFFLKSLHESFKFYQLNLSQTYHFILKAGWIKNLQEASHIYLFIQRNPLILLILFL